MTVDETKDEAQPVITRKRHSKHSQTKRKTSFWLMIILLITFIVSAFTMNIPALIDRYLNFTDKTYRPMDTDRMQYEKERQAPAPTRK